tara:strand:+ start:1274 stop:2122 length:849 start_codon:yes stop_codon:yes gene_type:complete
MIDKCGNIALGIVCLVIICLVLGLNIKDIIIIILISLLVVFIFQMIESSNKYYFKRMNDIKSQIDNEEVKKKQINKKVLNDNNINENNHINKFLGNGKGDLEKTPYHLQDSEDKIIPADKYNLEDCTTDKSCIQEPDVNNLFPGYHLSPHKVKKIKNESQSRPSKRINKIVVENFKSKTPQELNDVAIKPFANYEINPFAKQDNFKTKSLDLLYDDKLCVVNDPLCYHCKVGKCQGGACKDISELNLNSIAKKIINDSRPELPHPFSDSFPVIRVTNDEVAQ